LLRLRCRLSEVDDHVSHLQFDRLVEQAPVASGESNVLGRGASVNVGCIVVVNSRPAQ
jgi:hypothetical protein